MAQGIDMWFKHKCLQAFNWMLLLLLLAVLGVIWSSNALYQAKQYHQHLRENTPQNIMADDAIFADAVYWARHGKNEKSIKLYAEAASSLNINTRKNANYNMANLYLREANKLLEIRGFAAWDEVTPLLAMAKEGYREALRLDPGWLNAKYNYELVLRIAPTIESATSRQKPEDDEKKDTEEVPEGWPSIPGFPRGMP